MKVVPLDQLCGAFRLRAQKAATQWGDGKALYAFAKLSLLDYHLSKSVSICFE